MGVVREKAEENGRGQREGRREGAWSERRQKRMGVVREKAEEKGRGQREGRREGA